ncbi:hypothetical protein V5F72_24135 [Xanthobacter flavus]|uniref:hypothetical protein n=1 Tax=Xanthobacter flavus TaxID=281 RepID=UPI00372829B3
MELAALATKSNAPGSPEAFLTTYRKIDFSALGKLQGFRNTLAHVTWNDVSKFVTYGELEGLIRCACSLCHQTNLMTSGLNDDPSEHLEHGHSDALQFWTAALSADLDHL